MPITDLLATDGGSAPAAVDALDANPDAFYALPTDPFVYVFDAHVVGAWSAETVVPGDGVADDEVGTWWVLTPRKLVRRLGLNGFRKANAARPGEATDLARSRVRDEGGLWLDPAEHPYVAARPVLNPGNGAPGVLHHEVFATPIKPARGKQVQYKFDRQRYVRWLLSLHRDGVLPAPPEDLPRLHAAKVATRRERAATDTALDEKTRDRKLAALDEVEAKIEKAQPAVDAPAKPPRGRKPAKS